MFPEYRDLITRLKSNHPRFQHLFDKHNQLDHDITRLELRGHSDEVVKMKKEKLQIKDEIYKILQTESQKA
ncbi:YdcH family protein [Entomohabitans teleogrylli]|uniref:YdcH family protein n=1 Tax=Entomohabitans teleogrylli TaxID=1384589 RepID=UPI00073D202F|nr:YdcH family protein [Entomohabitans teleogrylli]